MLIFPRFFHPIPIRIGRRRQDHYLVLWMALAVIIPGELLRFRFKGFARTYEKLLRFLMRESERVRDS